MVNHLKVLFQKFNLAILFLWCPIALLIPKAMHLPLILISITGCVFHRFKNIKFLMKPEWGLLGLLIFWALVATQWSLDYALALKEWGRITPLFIAGGSVILYGQTLTKQQVEQHLKAFAGGLLLILFIIVIDRFLNYPIMEALQRSPAHTYSKFITLACLGLWGGLLLIPASKLRTFIVICLVLGIITFFWSYDFDAGPTALIIALPVMILTLKVPRFVSYSLRLGPVLITILVVIGCGLFMNKEHWFQIVKLDMDPTHQQRLELIDWASKKILEHPLGYGLSQTRSLSYADKITGYSLINGDLTTNDVWSNCAWHLHNGLLQIFLELGFVGFLLTTAIIWILLARLYQLKLPRYQLAVIHGYVATLFFIVSVGFGIWQIWWLSTIMMLTILYIFKVCDDSEIHGNDSGFFPS